MVRASGIEGTAGKRRGQGKRRGWRELGRRPFGAWEGLGRGKARVEQGHSVAVYIDPCELGRADCWIPAGTRQTE